MEQSLYATIREVDGPHFDQVTEWAWRPMYWLMSEKMLKMEKYEHQQIMSFINEVDKRNQRLKKEHKLSTHQQLIRKHTEQEKAEFFAKKFMKEVDFHHKIAYRFEKAYRLGKKVEKKQRATLNLEVIDAINEYMVYIEQDNMSLFYLVFFCIYYRNSMLLEFIRNLITKIPPHKKID